MPPADVVIEGGVGELHRVMSGQVANSVESGKAGASRLPSVGKAS